MNLEEYFKDDWEEVKDFKNGGFNSILASFINYDKVELFKKYYKFYVDEFDSHILLIDDIIWIYKYKEEKNDYLDNEMFDYIKAVINSDGSIRIIQEMKRKGIDWRKFV